MTRPSFLKIIRRITSRLAVLWMWPTLACEVLLVGLALAWVFDGLQAVLFGIWLVLLVAHPGVPRHVPKGSARRPYKRHSNLFAQKFCTVGLVVWFVVREFDTVQSVILEIGNLLYPSLFAAIWVWSWWSPTLDSRWQANHRSNLTDKDNSDERRSKRPRRLQTQQTSEISFPNKEGSLQ